jgi:hypothetical protein
MKNIKKVVKAMECNLLGEMFLCSAIESYCRNVLADDSDWGKSLIAKNTWQDIASETLTLLGE